MTNYNEGKIGDNLGLSEAERLEIFGPGKRNPDPITVKDVRYEVVKAMESDVRLEGGWGYDGPLQTRRVDSTLNS